MAGIAAYMQKAMLDWSLGGAIPTRPANWSVGLALGAPSSVSGSEIGTGSGLSRATCPFPGASSPAGSASNSSAMTFGPALSSAAITGIQVWDTTAAAAGNMLYYGTLATARTLASGDSLVIAVGSLVITLA
jgi:hypothetical protein